MAEEIEIKFGLLLLNHSHVNEEDYCQMSKILSKFQVGKYFKCHGNDSLKLFVFSCPADSKLGELF